MTKLMTLEDAVDRYVHDGAVLGLGGQNIGRCTTAASREIIRQGKAELTIVGCNLSISMDILVGAGLVRRCESGTGNLEQFGSTHSWRRKIQNQEIEVEDFSHLAMVSRFAAGEMGLPFMPTKSLLGSDLLEYTAASTEKKFAIIDNPWREGDPVVLLPAINPDVAIVHVQKSDPLGNLIIEGFATHEPEMIRASKEVIVTCEEIIDNDVIRANPEHTSIPHFYVSAVVHLPWGAHPAGTYRYYECDDVHMSHYQDCAREGGEKFQAYLDDFVFGCETFDEYLEKAAGKERLEELRTTDA